MAIRPLLAALAVCLFIPNALANGQAASAETGLVPWRDSMVDASRLSSRMFSVHAAPVIRPVGFRVNNGALLPADMPSGDEPKKGLMESMPESPTAMWTKAHERHKTTGFIDFNTYWDTRDMAVTTVNVLANLPSGFQYFQFTNYDSALGRGSHDWTGFYTEFNLRHSLWSSHRYLSHLDWALQYADGSGPHGVLRGGVRWRMQDTPGRFGDWFSQRWKLKYFLTLYFFETDSTGWQLEHVYRRDFFDGLLYVGGFCDHNIDNHSRNSTWVHEHQVGLRLAPSLYAVAEYRYKSFFPAGKRSGVGIGMEYVIRFK